MNRVPKRVAALVGISALLAGVSTLVSIPPHVTSGHPIPALSTDSTGNFRFICDFSHLNYDDPIVYPGAQGAAHLHMWMGNTLADYASTPNSLRTTGDGSCQGGPLNRSAYWSPALIDQNNMVVIPAYATVYYKQDHPPSVVNLPVGLVMVAGYNAANGQSNGADWRCENGGGATATIPVCGTGDKVGGRVVFPQCYNGQLDSPDHRSHLAYLVTDPNTGQPVCPATHSVHIPEFTFTVWYPADGTTNLWRLSSDMGAAAGSTLHSDWFGAWDTTISDTWTQECIRELRNCQGGELGDDRQLSGATNYTGPARVAIPPLVTGGTTTTQAVTTTTLLPGSVFPNASGEIVVSSLPPHAADVMWRPVGQLYWFVRRVTTTSYTITGLTVGQAYQVAHTFVSRVISH